jgi:hypothetical protein
MSPRAPAALAALATLASLMPGAAAADDAAGRSPDPDDAPLAALALALAAAPVPQIERPGPGAEAATREPRVDLAVTLVARSVVFEELPRMRMVFGRPGAPRAAWRVERENLPVRVEPGVEYRDVSVRLALSCAPGELESLVEDARRVTRGLRLEKAAAPEGGPHAEAAVVAPAARSSLPSRSPGADGARMDRVNAERARAGLLPRRSPAGTHPSGSAQPAPAADTPPSPPAPPALSQAGPAAPARPGGDVRAAAPERAASDFRPIVVVLAALRSRFPADPGGGGSSGADLSLESLRVRVDGGVVESLLVGRAGELTVSVRRGSTGNAGEVEVPEPAVAGAGPATAPAPAVSSRAASPAALEPILVAAPAPETSSREPAPSPGEAAGLLSRWTTARGEVMERTLDPSGRVVQRQVDPPDHWERAIDLSKLTLVSQRRDGDGSVVQVVQDVSGAHIEVTRDPVGRFLRARVLRR